MYLGCNAVKPQEPLRFPVTVCLRAWAHVRGLNFHFTFRLVTILRVVYIRASKIKSSGRLFSRFFFMTLLIKNVGDQRGGGGPPSASMYIRLMWPLTSPGRKLLEASSTQTAYEPLSAQATKSNTCSCPTRQNSVCVCLCVCVRRPSFHAERIAFARGWKLSWFVWGDK